MEFEDALDQSESELDQSTQKLRKIFHIPSHNKTPREARYLARANKKMAEDLAKALSQLSVAITKMGNKPQMTLAPFVGKIDKRSFVSFVREFNKLATAYGWTNREMCQNLPLYLKAEASAAYDEIETVVKGSWEHLLEALSKHLGVGDSVYSFRR